MLNQYEVLRDNIDDGIRRKDAIAKMSITPAEIFKMVEELKDLEHYGEIVIQALKKFENVGVQQTVPTYYKNKSNPAYRRRFMKWITQLAPWLAVAFQDHRTLLYDNRYMKR